MSFYQAVRQPRAVRSAIRRDPLAREAQHSLVADERIPLQTPDRQLEQGEDQEQEYGERQRHTHITLRSQVDRLRHGLCTPNHPDGE